MKNYIFLLMILVFLLGIFHTGCDENFEDINTSNIEINELDPLPLLNHAIWRSSPHSAYRQTMIYEMPIVQHMVTPFGTSLAGGNYNQENPDVMDRTWENYYPNVIRNTVDIIEKYREVPERSNVYNMARIIRTYAGMVLTDTYGDVPFSEAGLGFIEGIGTPVYDAQEAIYTSILSELDQATAALTTAGRIESGDILYGGDIGKWKRFGYSLMLRAAMRLSETKPSVAEQYVQKAITGGVMQSNDDNAVVRHNDNFQNYVGSELNSSESANFYMTKALVDFFKASNDPRLGVLAVRYVGATNGGQQTDAVANREPAEQIGMPMGYDNSSIGAQAVIDGVGSFYAYTQFDRKTIGKQTAPFFIVTFAQTQLLLAEAAVRGWASGNAPDYYSNGVKAHMEQLEAHDSGLKIEAEDIDAYLQANPLVAETAMEQINSQYWVACLFNAMEAFANFRRSDYPALVPNPYPQSSIATGFITRLIYPDREYTNNLDNINAAVSRQGADELDTKVWWDK